MLFVSLILQIRKLRHRGVKALAQDKEWGPNVSEGTAPSLDYRVLQGNWLDADPS